jgi:endonuclease/exonuclease/phosphatase family metal-dependent hydrolase
MILITWNVQWCRGCDGRVDPARIVAVARSMADFDVLCLQEVADGFPGLPGSAGEDQFAALSGLLPGYAPVAGWAVDALGAIGKRRRFGNLILSRLPVLAAFRHLLPWPRDPQARGMQRVAVEAVIDTRSGPLRVTTTHLEYYSRVQRQAQVERLRDLQVEACGHSADVDEASAAGDRDGPFAALARPASGILTADFNFRASDPEYARIQAPIGDGVPAYRDAWAIAHPGRAHEDTIGVYDRAQWPQPYACDFVFVTEDVAPRVLDVQVNGATDASDHQPVVVRLR